MRRLLPLFLLAAFVAAPAVAHAGDEEPSTPPKGLIRAGKGMAGVTLGRARTRSARSWARRRRPRRARTTSASTRSLRSRAS